MFVGTIEKMALTFVGTIELDKMSNKLALRNNTAISQRTVAQPIVRSSQSAISRHQSQSQPTLVYHTHSVASDDGDGTGGCLFFIVMAALLACSSLVGLFGQ